MQSSSPFLSVDFLYEMANIHICESNENPLIKIREQKNTPIVFLKTELLEEYVDLLLSIQRKYILITASNDDTCVPYYEYPANNERIVEKTNEILKSSFLISWYTKNACIVHEKIKPVPLGPKWQWRSTAFFGEDKTETLSILKKLCLSPDEMIKNSELDLCTFEPHKCLKKNLLYFNFTAWTTNEPKFKPHTNIRNQVIDDLKNKGFQYNDNTGFESYMNELTSYKFCVSPPGRGIDTHRTWEALMVGTIPIILSSPLNDLYKTLPCIVVDDFSIITKEFLNETYKEIIEKEYDYSILYTEYWKKQIENDVPKYTAVLIEPRCHNAMSLVLQNFAKNLSDEWNIFILHGNLNIEYVNNIINNDLHEYKSRITTKNLNIDNLKIEEYNDLLKSEYFYQYIPTETFLIFQTDTLIIEKYKEMINEFLEYDYVGAPWSETYLPEFGIHEYNAVGNGGLSLRKKSKMLEIIKKNKETELFKKMNEDICFSLQKNIEVKKPDFEKAKQFSIETIFSEKSFGVHCPWRWLSNEHMTYLINMDKNILKLIEQNSIAK
jgi:hypothetical protein